MNPMLRRLAALGIMLSFAAAFTARHTNENPPPPPSNDLSNGVSAAALTIGLTGLVAHRRRRAR